MQDFQYAAPTSIDQAVSLLAEKGGRAKLLAGGTDILAQLRANLCEADVVVDVKKIPELSQLVYSAQSGLRLGACLPCYAVYENCEIAAAYGALADATRIIGGWQIQNRASVGGNLCNASPAADSIGPLIVHGAICHVAGSGGKRSLPVEQFCTAPGRNALSDDELLIAVELPPPRPRSSSAYQRFIPRNEMDIAVVGAAVSIQLDESGGAIQQARIALAAVAPKPISAVEASDWLEGRPADEATFAEAGELAKKAASPISDMRGTAEYRTHLVGVLVKRTLAQAVARARQA